MQSKRSSLSKQKGFTLLEVLIAFSILATLLTVIIQSQSETIFFLQKTSKMEKVRKEVVNRLLAIERGGSTIEEGSGDFEEEHPLEGDRWILSKSSKLINNLLPMEEIKYTIVWTTNSQKQSFSAVLLR
ncbi:MAG: type II secretion system protein [Proteobacteria bacterium]|nr:type II secretion system protein [Pseudomonadota bacterium]